MEEILKNAKIKPACLQAESHPLFPNLELLEFCKKTGISFVSYSPLGKFPA
jgi:glycerol 2-dehydrogenase (NADP+)